MGVDTWAGVGERGEGAAEEGGKERWCGQGEGRTGLTRSRWPPGGQKFSSVLNEKAYQCILSHSQSFALSFEPLSIHRLFRDIDFLE